MMRDNSIKWRIEFELKQWRIIPRKNNSNCQATFECHGNFGKFGLTADHFQWKQPVGHL
jgi:hypothetical protein